MSNEKNPLFNKLLLTKKLAEYKTQIQDNSKIFLKWHNDTQKGKTYLLDSYPILLRKKLKAGMKNC